MKSNDIVTDNAYRDVYTPEEKMHWLNVNSHLTEKQTAPMIKAMDKAILKHDMAVNKLAEMRAFDRSYGYALIEVAGVDEAGRGPLAGPVVAAAVIMPEHSTLLGIDDSKKLTESTRDTLYAQILETCIAYGIGIVDHDVIDEINILEATKKAMTIALAGLQHEVVLIDAVPLKHQDKPVHGIIKGDEKSFAIAAASIIAKVTRDRLMTELDILYPEYGFKIHKGYGTAKHYAALDLFGPSPIHRKSFLRKWSEARENNR